MFIKLKIQNNSVKKREHLSESGILNKEVLIKHVLIFNNCVEIILTVHVLKTLQNISEIFVKCNDFTKLQTYFRNY